MVRIAGETEYYESPEFVHSGTGTSYILNHNKGKVPVAAKCYYRPAPGLWREEVDYWWSGSNHRSYYMESISSLNSAQIAVLILNDTSAKTIKLRLFF